jgi:hypothetical protein
MILFMRESSRFSFRRANIERRRSISSSFSAAIGECVSKHYMPLLACRMFNPANRRQPHGILRMMGPAGGTQWHWQTAMRISVSSWATTDEDVKRSVAAMIRIARRKNTRLHV